MALENIFQDIPATVIVFSEEVLCFRRVPTKGRYDAWEQGYLFAMQVSLKLSAEYLFRSYIFKKIDGIA